jgi:RNA polymerase sigma factor (TIGR02999 family)
LVREAYLRLVAAPANRREEPVFSSRGHFFAAAAEAMRRILVEQARRRGSLKRGGDRERFNLDESALWLDDESAATDLMALDEALQQLEVHQPLKAQLVKLRYFAGLSIEDAANALGISPATAKRYWVYARAWLYGRIRGEQSP